MTRDADRRIVPQHSLDATRRRRRAIAHDHDTRVLRVTHADATAVMERNPRRATRGVQQRVEQRPIGHRIRAILHALGLAIRARDRAGVEMIAADDDRRLELAGRNHLVERETEPMALPESDPADARRQTLEADALAR